MEGKVMILKDKNGRTIAHIEMSQNRMFKLNLKNIQETCMQVKMEDKATLWQKRTIWLWRLLSELSCPQQKSIKVWIDNKSAIELAKNPVHHERSKHIDVRFHFICEHVKEKNVHLHHVASGDQIADVLTKPLSRNLFDTYKRLMGMKDRKELV